MLYHGVARQELLARTGLRESMLKNPLTRIPAAIPEAMFQSAMELQPHPDWGFRIARYLSENSQRLTTLILFTASSIRSGFRRAAKVQHLNTTRGWFDLIDEAHDPFVYTRLHMPNLPNEGFGRHMIEATIGALSLYVARFAGEKSTDGYVSFRHAPAMEIEHYEAFFPGLELRFGAPHDELGFRREELDRHSPLAEYNRQVFESIASRAESIYAQLFGSANVEEQVRQILKEQLEEAPTDVSLESVASAMDMTARTLQRKLGKGGFSFNDLADDERRTVFLELITEEHVSFSDLATLCGFRSRESLYRSVKRWYGVTPSEYRERLVQSA